MLDEERSEPVEDRTAPVITLNGDALLAHEQGTGYRDAGAFATDDVSGSVTVEVSGSVGDSPGRYEIVYTASDAAGNTSQRTRTVVVSDTTPPTIQLEGDESISHPAGSTYIDSGATATDLVDGVIAVVTSGTVGAIEGQYTLTYSATDAAGNTATATRIVTVQLESGGGNDDLVVFAEGAVGDSWDRGISAFDAAIGFAECNNDGGAGCPSISWQVIDDNERGDVLQIEHTAAGNLAGVFLSASSGLDLSGFAEGALEFDIKMVSSAGNVTIKLDCVFPCTSGDQALGSVGASGWEAVSVPLSRFTGGGLDIRNVDTGIVIWATDATSTVFRINNVRFTGNSGTGNPGGGGSPGNFTLTAYGAGNISDTINPDSYRCVFDFGNFIYNAGIVRPEIAGCNTTTGIPSGSPTPRSPQLTGPAETRPTPTHKWWGSIPFLGEMRTGVANDAAYVTPDPMIARVSERGLRVMGIPSGLGAAVNGFGYPIPDPFAEVFDGIAVGNADFADMEAYLKDHSDGSVTVEWQAEGVAVMQATMVHGSPYVYFEVFRGTPVIRTLRGDGTGEKGIFYNQNSSLGVWTNVAGNRNNYLITGEGGTTFGNVSGAQIPINTTSGQFTLTYLPETDATPSSAMRSFFESYARNVVASVDIDYDVNRSNNVVTVGHVYKNAAGQPVTTIAGLHPLQWKNSSQPLSAYQVRSARGVIRFSVTSGFNYSIDSIGVLPSMPSIPGSYSTTQLEALVDEFIDLGPAQWNTETNTYWAGKNYGKVAELIAIADANGLNAQAATLLAWLKSELEDWFEADTNGGLDIVKYFVYDEEWNTVLGLEESFAAHQQLNDHHFHYGYFIRAAAEICRLDASWCGDDQYGPMIELLIRDFAGGRDDPMFPYLRNFDPANGFSWASGFANFVRGNNNESTSEAANAYGAMILYGLIVGDDELVERGMYLHASTAAAYWEYWNNIDGYNNVSAVADNFPSGYNRITTSIIWGEGSAFATFFSGAFAHILGIQGLPTNPLILHVGLYSDYMADYVALGLAETSNIRPSGLPVGQWSDIWWNLWAMTNPDAAIADYVGVSNYFPEEGETKAHTYHWLYTFARLGSVQTGTGALTANYPAAVAFERDGITHYVVYNFGAATRRVTFSDGQVVNAQARGFTVISN